MGKESKIIRVNSFVRGYHAYKMEIWEPDVNDENPLKCEPNDIAEKRCGSCTVKNTIRKPGVGALFSYSTTTVRQVMFLIVKIEKLVVGIFLVSGVWHVGWWSLITSVRLIQVGNNRDRKSVV